MPLKPLSPDPVPMLVFLGSERHMYRAPVYSPAEIYCGPGCETIIEGGLYRSIKLAPGAFDIAALVNGLPAVQKPEIVVVNIDRTGRTLARNLSQLDCIKVLQITDTHHMPNPITFILEYLQTEHYDIVTSEPCRHHLHYFIEAGFPRVHWLPLINVNPFPQPLDQPLQFGVLFVGSCGPHHLIRQAVLGHLQNNGIPVTVGQAPQQRAAEAFARAAISLNISLNGDYNFRVLEVLSAGGFLITDRVSAQCGLHELFEDGKEIVLYNNPDDLVDKIRYYAAHPAEAMAIRRAGQARYFREQTPAIKIRQFFDLVRHNREEPAFSLDREPRCRRPRGLPMSTLLPRIRAYEHIQEEHRKILAPRLLATAGVSNLLLADCADLFRLEISVEAGSEAAAQQRAAAFAAEGVAGRIRQVKHLEPVAPEDTTTLLVLSAGEIGQVLTEASDNLLDRLGRPAQVLVENGRGWLDIPTLSRLTETMARRGYSLSDAMLPAYRRT